MGTRSVQVSIGGRVQGVGFRAWTQRQAAARGLAGWVCNRRDGSVEALFCGDADAVAAMLVAVHIGPAGSRVDSVSVSDAAAIESGPFSVRATY